MLEFQRNRHNRGFTIIEIILALLIISLIIVGVLMFFPTSRRATEESALKARIANSVVSEVEVIKAVGYKSLEKLLGTYSRIMIELIVKGGSVKVYFDNVETQNSASLLDTLKIGNWNSSLNELGVEKGVIEIKRVSGVDNLLSVKVRVEYGSGKNYEINTYISL